MTICRFIPAYAGCVYGAYRNTIMIVREANEAYPLRDYFLGRLRRDDLGGGPEPVEAANTP